MWALMWIRATLIAQYTRTYIPCLKNDGKAKIKIPPCSTFFKAYYNDTSRSGHLFRLIKQSS
jgi:hypothetical protein